MREEGLCYPRNGSNIFYRLLMAFEITKRCTIMIAADLSPVLWAQNTPDIQQTYSKLGGGCHGDDARGTQQGPGLSGNPSVRGRSAQSLRNVIRNGIPAAGMPT